MKRRSIVLLLAVGLSAVSDHVIAYDPLALQVFPSVSTAPANVRIRARVARDADNRGMEIAADSAFFYRSSFITLEGEKAPSVTELAFRDLPGGDYRVSVVLHGSRGVRATASRQIRILSLIE